ncbi:insect cuticle protein domain-containing protein [Phthorimaea operculella]|nr:insect cuticle protein domain-containing protein [Phthorimaea operculella]
MFSMNIVIKVDTAENDAVITEYNNENLGSGEYNFRFVQSDGIEREESGKFEGEGNYVVQGYYSYIDPTGKKQFVEYTADSTGYHPMIVDQISPSLQPEYPGVVVVQALPQAVVASLIG